MTLESLFRNAGITLAAVTLVLVAGCSSSAPSVIQGPPRAVEATDVTHIAAETVSNVMYFPTDDRKTSILEIEQVAPREIHSGVEYTYQLKVTNRTPVPLQNVLLSRQHARRTSAGVIVLQQCNDTARRKGMALL